MVKLGWKGLKKPPKIKIFGLKVCSLGPRGDPYMRPWGNPRWDLEATRHARTLGQPARTSRQATIWPRGYCLFASYTIYIHEKVPQSIPKADTGLPWCTWCWTSSLVYSFNIKLQVSGSSFMVSLTRSQPDQGSAWPGVRGLFTRVKSPMNYIKQESFKNSWEILPK